MSPERSEQINRIVRAALGRPAAERSAFIDGACAGDEEVRALVESLLASRGEGVDGGARRAAVSAETTRAEVVPGRTSLGPYKILEKLGAGGMGTVYLALDTRLGRRVALKLLPVHMASDEESVRRFEQEARAASALNHPNILTVHDIGESDGRRFIATEYVEGRDLRQRAAESPLSLTEALEVCAQAASALAKAHAAGIIHRDVKPENVMVDEEGHVKVLDFGIAKRVAPRHSPDPEAPTSAQVNTGSGVVLGTSTYMSPEQVRGLELDARTDLWSLGCVLYEIVAGRPPFGAHTYGDLVVAILHEEPPPLGRLRPDTPEELERIIRKALAKRREDRYQSAREMQTDLRRLKSHLDFQQGAGAAHDPALAPAAPPHPRATTTEQRKQVTVLFADASGLAELAGGADAEELSELLEELWGRVRPAVEGHGGALTKSVGDTVLALWGAREAREDDPERAVLAALSMQHEAAEVARLRLHGSVAVASPEDEGGGVTPSLMRVGVSTGLVLLGEASATGELTATGEPVQLASRLQQSASEGGVLITHDTYRHVRGVFDVLSPEPLTFGGRAVEVYRVMRAKPRAFRVQTRGVEGVETRMVGRKAELRRLMDALEEVFEERELQVVTVVGEAGLGKSRLLYEFSNWHELLPDAWYVFNGRASEATEGLPYALVRDVFSFRFEIQDSDPPGVAREKLERGVARMNPRAAAEEARVRAHFIGQLIGFDYSESPYLSGILDDARQIRDRAFRYAAQFFADASHDYPIVVYLDDIHWADDGSLDFIDYLARSCESAPVFVLCLARQTLLERRPAWGEGLERHARVQLQPLSKKESRQLVEEIMRRARGVPSELRELVVGGAEGNPFYVEELIKMLIDQRVIVPGAVEWNVDASRLGEVHVPPTLTGVLQARLDKLSPVEKSVLQRASVVGRVFWDGAVSHLGASQTGAIRRETSLAVGTTTDRAEEGGGVYEALESLRRKELVHRREASGFAGAREYSFKHALLRDVTYESVLRRERREYHRRAAEWLARHSGGRVGEYAGLVAEHYERAQEREVAAEWYGRAGRQARETYAPESAIRYYRRALEFLTKEEGQAALARRAEWFEGLGEVLRVQARYAEAVEAYAEMRAAAKSLGDAAAEARAWNEIALAQNSQGDNRAAFESTRRAEEIARGAGPRDDALAELARALNLQSQASSRLGDPQEAMRLADKAFELASALGEAGRRARADSLKSLGMAHHALGRFEPADDFKERALLLFRELGDRRAVGNLLNSLGETARLRGDYSTALAHYLEALSIAREIGNRIGEILYLSNLGAARAGLGEYAEAEADLRQATRMASEAGYVGLSENYRFLAEALLGQGRLEETLEAALRALDLGREIENQEHIAEAWRALGLVASRAGRAITVGDEALDAPACFARSLAIFTLIRMEAQRARTLRDWARHELSHGHAAPGHEMWAEARHIFQTLNMPLELARMDSDPPA